MGLEDFQDTINQAMDKLREDHAAELRDLETRKEAEFEKERAENQAIIEKLQKTIEEGSGKDHTI